MVDVTILGISLQEDGPSPVLLLHPAGTRRILSVAVSPIEAVAISAALHGTAPCKNGKIDPPMTHALFLNAVRTLGAELAAVELVGRQGDEFSARVVLAHNGFPVRVTCRPADGVTLALHTGASVRCASSLLAQAESIDAIMTALPEHARTLMTAKPGEQSGRDMPEWLRVPLAVEEALSARAKNGAMATHKILVSVAHKMLEEDDARRRSGTVEEERAPRVRLGPGGAAGTPKKTETPARAPQIRVTMARHTGKGDAEVINEFDVPAGGIPSEALVCLGLSRQEIEEVNGASEDERWTTLLRMLAPSTKVPM